METVDKNGIVWFVNGCARVDCMLWVISFKHNTWRIGLGGAPTIPSFYLQIELSLMAGRPFSAVDSCV